MVVIRLLILMVLSKKYWMILVWWCMPVILTFVRLRQENCELKTSLGYIVRPYLKKKKKRKEEKKKEILNEKAIYIRN
jgi:hypothetical protein